MGESPDALNDRYVFLCKISLNPSFNFKPLELTPVGPAGLFQTLINITLPIKNISLFNKILFVDQFKKRSTAKISCTKILL